MAKSSKKKESVSSRSSDSPDLIPEADDQEPEYTSIVSLYPSRLVVPGSITPSGESYVFENGGATVSVLQEDVEALLARRRDPACCGGAPGETRYFAREGEV